MAQRLADVEGQVAAAGRRSQALPDAPLPVIETDVALPQRAPPARRMCPFRARIVPLALRGGSSRILTERSGTDAMPFEQLHGVHPRVGGLDVHQLRTLPPGAPLTAGSRDPLAGTFRPDGDDGNAGSDADVGACGGGVRDSFSKLRHSGQSADDWACHLARSHQAFGPPGSALAQRLADVEGQVAAAGRRSQALPDAPLPVIETDVALPQRAPPARRMCPFRARIVPLALRGGSSRILTERSGTDAMPFEQLHGVHPRVGGLDVHQLRTLPPGAPLRMGKWLPRLRTAGSRDPLPVLWAARTALVVRA